MKTLPFTVAMTLATMACAASTEPPSLDRQAELLHLLKADCGSCHGLTLKGGLGPALLAQDIAQKPDEFLFMIIKEGQPGTPMPPWERFLNDNEIHWLVHVLRNEEWK
jgi:cytochrome c55X